MSFCAFHTDGQVALNDPQLNCPRMCGHGSGCSYTGPGGCAFVHPGEEGTGRRLFPARSNPQTGEQQRAAVRLIGSPGFYERRRLKMSWKQWCALPKNEHLRASLPPAAAPQKQQKQAQKADVWNAAKEQAASAAQPAQAGHWIPMPMPTVPFYQTLTTMLAVHEEAITKCPESMVSYHTQEIQQLKVAARTAFGEALYVKIAPFLTEVKPSLIEAGQWCETITAGKLTGMILEGHTFKELCVLLRNESKGEMEEMLADGCHLLKTVADAATAAV
jgi:hypothetical protein